MTIAILCAVLQKDKKLLSFLDIIKLKKNRRKEGFSRNLIRFIYVYRDVKRIINFNLNMIITSHHLFTSRGMLIGYYIAFIVCKFSMPTWTVERKIFSYCLYFLLSIFSLFNAQMCVCSFYFKLTKIFGNFNQHTNECLLILFLVLWLSQS